MKKLSLLILTSFISALLFNVSTAFAVPDDKKLKVYYSESIGAGQKVYHIVTCNKAPAWAPYKCIAKPSANPNQTPTEVYFNMADQCIIEGKALDGEYVKGCTDSAATNAGTGAVGDAVYPVVDLQKYKKKKDEVAGGCKDAPELQGFKYANECTIVYQETADESTWKPKGLSVVWHEACDSSSMAAYINDKFASDPKIATLKAVQLYRPALCVTYDVPAPGVEGAGEKEAQGKFKEKDPLKDRLYKLFSEAPSVTEDEDCNTDNSKGDVADQPKSTPFNAEKTYSCSIVERITGYSGSEVLANYIGAIYRWAAGIVGIVAVLIMVASGIQISAAGGDSAKLDSAKNRILQSIIGLVVLFLSGLILYTINPTFFTGG